MNQAGAAPTAEPVPSVDAAGVVAWVKRELGRFACARMAEPSALARAFAEIVAPPPRRLQGPIALLVKRTGARPAELFVLGLAGAIEAEHQVGALVSELQSAGGKEPGEARPNVELVKALLAATLNVTADDATEVLGLKLVECGVLSLVGEGPVPQRAVAIEPRLWSVLAGGQPTWPGSRWLEGEGAVDPLAAAAEELLVELAAALRRGARGVVVRGGPWSGRATFAARLAARVGLKALEIPAERWQSDRALPFACACGGWLPVVPIDAAAGDSIAPLADRAQGPFALLLGPEGAVQDEGLVEVALPGPTLDERRARWRTVLRDPATADVVAESPLSGVLLERVARHAATLAERSGQPPAIEHVAAARRRVGVGALRSLAVPVERAVPAEGIVLPPVLHEALDRLVERCRRRESLWSGLGATLRCTMNPGVRALFVGESGTGKTLAASVVATALGAPLFRVDLAAVMNKYVGESEKNLARVFDHAASLDAMLLFDEADALFGQRTEGHETGERYLNMLTSFLLTKLEAFGGIALLTSNSRSRIDPAFLRRLDVVLEFPLPGPTERRRLWETHLGDRSPGAAEVEFLASWCDLAGGHVRNAVLAAAARCPEGRLPLARLQESLVDEYRKLGRAVPGQLAPRAAGGT